jgi:hypothetical protein
MRVPKEDPHKLLRSVEKRSRVLWRRQTLPASGHFGTFSVRTKLMTDFGGREIAGGTKSPVETHIVILAMMYLPAFSDFLVF